MIAAIPAAKAAALFALTFAGSYNQTAKTSHWPWRIQQIACQKNGEAVYDCAAVMVNLKTSKHVCGALVIGNDRRVWASHRFDCKLLPGAATVA